MDGENHMLVDSCEVIHTKTARVLAEYADGWYAGNPAVTCHDWGKGQAVYQACRDTDILKEQLLDRLLLELGIVSCVEAPAVKLRGIMEDLFIGGVFPNAFDAVQEGRLGFHKSTDSHVIQAKSHTHLHKSYYFSDFIAQKKNLANGGASF